MNDIVRYAVYSPERDRREFRYLFPAVFLYVLLYICLLYTSKDYIPYL